MRETRGIWFAALCAAIAFLPVIALSAPTANAQETQSRFVLYGEAGDLISGGANVSYAESASVSLYATVVGEAVYVTVIASDLWYLDFAAPDGRPLRVGEVVSATLLPLQARGDGGMHVYGDGRDCVQVDAQFVVRELQRDALGDIESLAIDFTQSCNGGPSVLGGVRIDSAFQATPQDPTVPAAGDSAPAVRGDVNCDNVVNVTDAMTIAQYAVGNRSASSVCPLADPRTQIYLPSADFNRNGGINVTDALLVAQCSVFVPNGYC